MRAGQHRAARGGVTAGELLPIALKRGERDPPGQPERPRAIAQRVAERAGPQQHQRPRRRCGRGRVQQLADALLPGQAPDVEDLVAAGDLGPRHERGIEPEPQRQRRRPPRVERRVDHRHHGVDVEVGVAVPAPQRRRVDRAGAGQPGGLQRGRRVVHGDHGGALLVGDAADQPRRPERVVDQHDVGGQRFQRLLDAGAAERQPVAVGRRQAQRPLRMAAAAVARRRRARDDEMVLEAPGVGGEPRLGLQIRPDPAGPLAVEDRDVGDPQRPGAGGRGVTAAAGGGQGQLGAGLRMHGLRRSRHRGPSW